MRERPFVADLVSDQTIPKMFKVKQVFPRPKIEPEEIPGIIESLLSQEKFSSKVKPGMRIAITAGSRGIANVALTTKCIADFVRSRGAHPFIVPAMGSHCGRSAGDPGRLRNHRGLCRLSYYFFHGGQKNRGK